VGFCIYIIQIRCGFAAFFFSPPFFPLLCSDIFFWFFAFVFTVGKKSYQQPALSLRFPCPALLSACFLSLSTLPHPARIYGGFRGGRKPPKTAGENLSETKQKAAEPRTAEQEPKS